MADDAPRKGFSLSKPGPKEYLLVGGSALVLFLVYKWYKSKTTAAATPAAATDTSGNAPGTPTGLSTAQLLSWIHDHNSSSTTTTTATNPATTPGGTGGPPAAKTITVPNVTGERANFAIGKLQSAGLTYTSASGARNPKLEYTVASQQPGAGAKAASDTPVALTFRVS